MLKKFRKSLKNLNSDKFLFGFEVEFVYYLDKISENNLIKKFKALHPKIETDYDGSVYPDGGRTWDDGTMEVKTPPLPCKQAFALLEEVFKIVDKYGYTNDSCGFHVNFSPVCNKLFYKINPFVFTTDKLWKKIVKDFNREYNDYCRPVFEENKLDYLRLFKQVVSPYEDGDIETNSGKGAVVNFENYFLPRQKDSRIEVRGFGNRDYQKKFTKIINYSEKILQTFMKSCEV